MAKSFNDLPTSLQAGILIAVAVLLAGATFWFYALPINTRREALKKEVDQLKAENQRNQAFEQERTEYLNRIAQLEKQLTTLRSIVPDEQATDEFMKMVFDAGATTGVNIRTFIPQSLVTRDFYIEMPFTMRMDGNYFNVLNFFDRLAHEQRIVSVNVSTLVLGTPGGGGMGAYSVNPIETVGANCVVTTYFNRPQPAAPPKKR
jgi:type IV pilus assembly protein PilO